MEGDSWVPSAKAERVRCGLAVFTETGFGIRLMHTRVWNWELFSDPLFLPAHIPVSPSLVSETQVRWP